MKKITNEVLCERLENFFRENKNDHEQIIAQTTKTNGSVSSLQKWRYQITGALVVLNIFIVPIVLFLVFEQLKK